MDASFDVRITALEETSGNNGNLYFANGSVMTTL